MSQGSQQTRLFVTSNRSTPSTRRHINSLPPELLRHILWCYCSFRYGPLPLFLVCRLWHAIASDCSALWGNIHYNLAAYYYYSNTETPISNTEIRQRRIFCDTWARFRWAVKRAGIAPLNLRFSDVDTHKLLELYGSDIQFLTRCRELSLMTLRVAVAFLDKLPALEHLEFQHFGKDLVDELFNVIERGSPLLWSLKLCGVWSLACLVHHPPLLRRIRCLDVDFTPGGCSDEFIMGLQNLTELTVRSSLHIPRLAFPKLLSLTIWDAKVAVDENMEFPVLDCLTLHRDWSILPLIVAPKLTKLVLECEKTPYIPWAALLQATVRPTSFVLFYPPLPIVLPELLTMWSDLLELHLVYEREVSETRQVQLAMLGGNSDHGRLCPHLRYLTVHVNQGQRDPMVTGPIIQTLHTIVEERKRHETDELRRVMCVWENWHTFCTAHPDKSKEIEWVDVL